MRVVRPHLRKGIFAALPILLPALLHAQQKPTLSPADYAQWESFGTTELSPDGAWLAYVIDRVEGDDELRIRRIDRDSVIVVAHASRPTFSRNGRWLAYSIGVSDAERDRLQKASQTVPARAGIMDLRTGMRTVIDNITTFDFSADGDFVALRVNSSQQRSSSGADVIVRDLERGVDISFANIASFSWQDSGALLAMVVDAEKRIGNGVRLFDPRSGAIRVLVSDTSRYTALSWRDHADDLAALRVVNDTAFEEPNHVLLAWRGLSGGSATLHVVDPRTRAGVPAARRIVDFREPQWSDDGRTLYFGIRDWTRRPVAAPPADSTKKPAAKQDPAGVEVWHAADIEIIPEQKMRAGIERNSSHLVAWHLDDDRVVALGSEHVPDVTLSDGRYAVGFDLKPYEADRMFGPSYRDVYAIDTHTGERRRAIERVQFQYGVSTTGRYLLYVRDGHYWTYDTRSGRHTNITRDVPTSFINVQDDHTVPEKPPYGTGGWTAGEQSVLLFDRYDIWDVRADGTGARKLTDGAADRVRHRRVWLRPDDRVVDLSKPFYVTLYGERSKKGGYGYVRPDGGVERAVFLDRSVSRLTRADSADVYMFRVEGADDSPDVFVAGPTLVHRRQVTNTNPFQQKYAWTRGELIDYRNTHGRELQAALLYPANYESGRRYPMIIHPYEITSNTLHHYVVPTETSAFNTTVFTQNGYFVLRPDIVYRSRNPGLSAVEALLPALDVVLATGMIDAARVGIAGHSWGAYQTAFAITQTDRFAAAVAGAPLTDLISMYLSIYWNTGGTDARIFEIEQGRMEVPFWEDLEAYMRNSPLFHVRNMNTPLLVAFGDRDGAVDWHQGIELYNAARRADKQMVMLVYEGENHSLSRKPNQIDYHRRINEWFAHYLKDEPAPEWITNGVTHIARERELELLRRGGN